MSDDTGPEHQVTAALLRLAGHRTPDRIAEHLHDLGVVGDHGCSSCPIANYVRHETGLAVLVTQTTWQLATQWNTPWTLPAPVGAFIHAHDRDQYPQLITEPVTA